MAGRKDNVCRSLGHDKSRQSACDPIADIHVSRDIAHLAEPFAAIGNRPSTEVVAGAAGAERSPPASARAEGD